MRRWIAIFLMIVLPLQLSWAVAASYCQDEQGSGAQHFGHHFHADQDGVAVSPSPLKNKAPSQQHADLDCGCAGHLCGAHMLPTGVDTPLAPDYERQHAVLVLVAYQSADPPRIERPNWPVSL